MKRARLIRIFSIAVALLLGLSGCSSEEPMQKQEIRIPSVTEEENKPEAPTSYRRIELSRELQDCNDAVTEASLNLFSEILKDSATTGNVIISPLSVNYVLAALVNGAEGETRQEIMDYFGIDSNESLNELFKLYSAEFGNLDNQVALSLGNSIWVDHFYMLNPEYEKTMRDGWPVELFSVAMDTPLCRDLINSWVEEKTKGLIPNFLDKIPKGPMGIFNTVYFKGSWRHPFEKSATVRKNFHGTKGAAPVDMMHGTRHYLCYSVGDGWQGVSLPYGNGNFEMRLILPDEGVSLGALSLSDLRGRWGKNSDAKVTLPKFECRYKNQNMEETLKGLGIDKLFSVDAELSKLLVGVESRMHVEQFIHEALVKVDESGAELAGASGAIMCDAAGDIEVPDMVDLVFDRPFLFEIRETSTNTLIFIGAVRDIQN